MALIRCPECNKEVSSQATNCPKCGYPLKSQNSNDFQQSKLTAVHVIAIAYLVLSIIVLIAMIILCVVKYLTFFDCIIFVVSSIISLILLFSLDDAIQRITVLENKLMEKGVVTENELCSYESSGDIVESPTDLAAKGIVFCKNCNYQLFPEDTVCPNCGTKVKRADEDSINDDDEMPDNEEN